MDQIGDVSAVLRAQAARLRSVGKPVEAAFLVAGQGLADTVADLNRVEADFAELSGRLEGQEALGAISGIHQAVACIEGLVAGLGSGGGLGQLAEHCDALGVRLAMLRKIAGEVGVLAMNAKIQASQLTAGATDFTVFTTDMAKLAGMALATIDRAAAKVTSLAEAVRRARDGEVAFTRSSAVELTELRRRLDSGIAVIAERRRRAAAAAGLVGTRSRQEARRVNECIARFQINDITSQRVGHVSDALQALDGVLADGSEADGRALAAAVCQLQVAQLTHAAGEFRREVEALASTLGAMAGDAAAMVEDAVRAFGGDGNGTSFAGGLEADLRLAARLVDEMAAARGRMAEVMATVREGVGEIVSDLAAITSLDADMQVMGLNATFKCGRLGAQGRALGVVAQELRSCSRRTEENAHGLIQLLDEVTRLARSLDTDAAGQCRIDDLATSMRETPACLEELGRHLDGALARLAEEGGRATSALREAAAALAGQAGAAAVLTEVARVLERLAGEHRGADTAAVRARVRELLSTHYTMASERLIHQLADDGAPAAPSSASQDVDAFFF